MGGASPSGAEPESRDDAFIKGVWWPPARDDLQAEGTVSAFAEGAVWLDVNSDPWGAVPASDDEEPPEVRVLFGRTLSGKPMCLHGVRDFGGERSLLDGQAQVRYVADRLIIGAAVLGEDDVVLASVGVSFRGLREWLMSRTQGTTNPLPVVSPRSSEDAQETTGRFASFVDRFRTRFKREGAEVASAEDMVPRSRDEEWVRIAELEIDGVGVQVLVSRSLSFTSQFESRYTTSASLRFETSEPLTLTEWRRNWIDPLRDLVLFGTREQVVTLGLSGDAPGGAWQDRIRVYMAPEVELHRRQHSGYHQRDLLPAGIWDEEGFADLINAWRTLHLELGAVAQAFFEILNSSDVAPLTRLLRLTSCAEGYHRSLLDEPPFAAEEHESMVEAMLDALPEDKSVRKHYADRLNRTNSQSQRKRIRFLIERASEVDERLQGRAGKLTGRLVDWRNDHTHLDVDVAAPPLDDLVLLNAVLTYVLEANILMDLGIGDDTMYCLAHGYVWDDPIPALVSLTKRRT